MGSVLEKTKRVDVQHPTNGGSTDSTFESRHAETHRRLLEFMSDPEVIAKYGHLLSGESPEWEEDDSEDEVPDEACREATRELRRRFHEMNGIR